MSTSSAILKARLLSKRPWKASRSKEMGGASAYSLQDLIAPADDLIVDPMPNLYFTRDPFASVGTSRVPAQDALPRSAPRPSSLTTFFRYHPRL